MPAARKKPTAKAKRAPKAVEPEATRPVGRPSEMTEDVVSKMLEGISLGMSIVDVSYLAGKSRTTIYNWIEAAESGKAGGTATEDQLEFLDSVNKAQREGQLRRLHRIQSGDPGWQGSAWIQERRYSREWGAKQQVELSGPNGGPLTAQIVRMPAKETPDEWSKRNK